MLHFQLGPMLLTFEQFVLQTLSNLRLVIIAATCSLPFHSHLSWISVLHLFYSNYISALLSKDMDTVSPWIQGFRSATQRTSFMSLPPTLFSTGCCCPGSRWHLLLHRSTEVSPSLPPVNNLTQCRSILRLLQNAERFLSTTILFFSLFVLIRFLSLNIRLKWSNAALRILGLFPNLE